MGLENLSTVGPVPLYGCIESHELTRVVQLPQTHKPYSSWGLRPQVFSLCESESSTSPAQAARPELLEGGHLAPQPMDFDSIFGFPCFSLCFLASAMAQNV